MRKLFTTLLVLISGIAFAQEPCGFDVMHNKMMAKDADYANYVRRMNDKWTQSQNVSNNSSYIYNGYGKEYVIPVVVHVIHTGGAVGTIYNPADTVIENAIAYLNETYAATYSGYVDTNNGGVRFPVRFELAKRAPGGCGSTSGINRVDGSTLTGYAANGVNSNNSNGADDPDVKALSRWNNREYYNIWVVNRIDGADGTSGSFTAGYAYFPGARDTIDGTIILATRMKSGFSTLPHEIGHAFSLYHTFEGDNNGATCPTNTTCTANGDLICDTDPHRRNASTCPADNATNTCTALLWSNNYTHKNIMDYSSCRNRFSAGQRTRFLSAVDNDRPGLGSSLGAIAPTSNVVSASCSPVTTTPNSFAMGVTKVELNNMVSNSQTSQFDLVPFGYTDRSCQQRATVTQGQSYTLSVNGGSANNQDVEVYIDYNNDGSFGSGENVYSGANNTSFSTTYAVPTSGVTTCTPLRMRVIVDWFANTITGPCYTPQYGEVEDFTVFVKPQSDTVTMFNTITAGSNPTCPTGSVTFTASASKSLSGVSYQWYNNSQPVGTNSSTYTASSLATGTYYIQCKVKYTGACHTDSMMTNVIALVSGTTVTPSVSIAANPAGAVCSGTNVTFTATPTNGGGTPAYQWKVNGGNVGNNSTTFSSTSLSNGDAVTCVITSNDPCASPVTGTSNTINMNVTGTVTPSVSIVSGSGTSVCAGASVTFTATPTNGGGSPTYQWKVNGGNVGTNSNTYTTSSLTNGQTVTCEMTSNNSCASPSNATSNSLVMTVTATVTPAVTIAANPSGTICAGTSVTFTPAPTNGGTTPTYQWKVNGSNVATGTTYTTSSLTNGQTVTCEMTSNATCPSPAMATSNSIVMSVTSTVTPAVSIAASPSGTVCSGANVTFTATPTNGGTTPAYQWKVNGGNVGTNSNTYATTALSNGDVVTCELTSNATCVSPATATSNSINMSVSGTVTPSVSIVSNSGTSICAGANVTFTATPANGGTTPAYQWKVNGGNVGTNSSTYSTTTLANGDAVTCVLTSNANCASPATATSNTINMSVGGTVVPSVSIASGSGTSVCAGASVTFTATPTNGGSTPVYQWKVNGSNAGTNSNTFTTSTLANNDVVTCEMTSSAGCASPATATSNSLAMTVTGTVTPSVTIVSGSGVSICAGASVTFTATPTNGGTPAYQWKVNGVNAGTNSNTFTTSALANNDVVTCEMTSSIACASPATATSPGLTMTTTGATAAVTIVSDKGSTICGGDTVTFTATPTNGGTTPAYQWKVNGANAGANLATFKTTSLSNGDVVTCVLTSSSSCVTNGPATSTAINMTVNPKLTPVVAIALSPNDTICAGTSVTFTATITNGGSTPAYQWKVNGSNVGTNSAIYVSNTLADGDVVICELTSSEVCVTAATVASNSIVMTVNPILTPVITISVSPNDTICSGTSTTFTATTANGGANPAYQWRRNGVVVGGSSSTYNSSSLADGDNILCILTTSEACVSKTKDTSNVINMTVNPNLTPAVSITVSPDDTICAGTPVTFTAAPVNGGSTPSYQWKVNGVNAGTNSNTFLVGGLNNNDVVTCVLTSSEVCVTTPTATSNAIIMTVNPIITPDVTIVVSPNDTICAGTMTTFTATAVNGGTSPVYQWQLNGFNAGTNSNIFSSTTFSSGDVIRCIMTSNGVCLTRPDDTSNEVTMEVIPNVTPAVVITRFPNDTICEGTNVIFSANFANGGASPAFQWQVNGANVGSNSPAFSSTTLNNGDMVRCYMTTDIVCVTKPTDTSNVINMGVKTKTTPDVVITVGPDDTVCQGTAVTFTAAATNAGTAPAYQWQVNGTDVATNSATYVTNTLADGDMVRCIITTTDTCVTKNMDTSNVIIMTIQPVLTPEVTTTVAPNDTICVGDMAAFTAIPVHGGTNPAYQWRVNGVNTGTNSDMFATTTLADGDVVDVIMTSSELCVTKAMDTSDGMAITVKPKVTPDVSIIVLPNSAVCDGTNVTFIATPINEGPSPTYQWQVNGVNVGTNATSFSSTTLANGDVVRCIMTSSEMCVTKAMDTSNEVTMTIYPNLTPGVTITVSPNDTICAGTSVTFTATPVNGGGSPAYQWRVNGVNAGSSSATFVTATLADGDVVDVILTSNETCLTRAMDTSNSINMTVKPYLTPVVTIAENPNDTVCAGTPVTFTATPADGGTTPVYQWQINGANVGANSTAYMSSTLANNDVVRVIMTSSEMCVTKAADTSNEITMTVNPVVTPDITITVTPNDTVCDGTLVSFLATPVNEGATPNYQWKINGSNVGINANGYSSNSFVNGDVVTCVLTSSLACVTKTMDTSNAVTMTVNPLTSPALVIAANTGTTACDGGEVTFTATPFNGGTAQAYQWRLNGVDIAAANSTTYMTNTLASGDVITCRLDITAVCPDPDSAISNPLNMNIVTPSASISVLPNDTICDNESAIFLVAGTNVGNSPIYQWSLNSVDQTGVTGNIFTMNTVSHQDLITTRFVSSDNCINGPAIPATNSITMTVNPTAPPSAGIAANPGTVLTNSDIVWFTSSVNTPNATYQWRKNGVDIPGANGIVYTDLDPQDGDTISLFITTTDSCRNPDTALSNLVVLSVGVGVREVETAELFDAVNIAPNPNNGTFTLSGTLSKGRTDEHVYVEVVNAVGAVIHREEVLVKDHELKTRIELGDKAHNGLHLVRISAEGRVHIIKFIANR